MANEQVHEKVRRLRRLCVAILDELADRLPENKADGLRRFLGVGEYGLFVDELAATLAKRGIAVTPEEYTRLAELVSAVEDESYQPSRFLPDVIVRKPG